MRVLRVIAGLICIAAALVLIVVLALGGPGVGGAHSPALMAHLPPVVFGLALLALGVWLLKGKR
jgi:lipopolysaccharide export LptBFGC system permease protein LptF